MKDWKVWLRGLAAVMIGAFATSVSGALAMPDTFNFSGTGLLNLLKLATAPALLHGFLYLAKSPLPGIAADDVKQTKEPL